MEWYDRISGIVSLASGGQDEYDLLTNMDVKDSKGATITRIVLTLDIRASTVNVYNEVFLGLTCWPQEAFLAGIMPEADDEDDNGAGWMYRGRLWTLVPDLNTAPGLGASVNLDLRA